MQFFSRLYLENTEMQEAVHILTRLAPLRLLLLVCGAIETKMQDILCPQS